MKPLFIELFVEAAPLSLRTIISYAINVGILNKDGFIFHEENIRDKNFINSLILKKNGIFKCIQDNHIDTVFISVWIWNIEECSAILHTLNKMFPQVRVIAGGYGVLDPESFLREHKNVYMYCYESEGEESFVSILHHLRGNIKKECVTGVKYIQDGVINTTPNSKSVNRNLTHSVYRYTPTKYSSANIEVIRGCVNKCAYCTWSKKKHSISDLDNLIDDINGLPDGINLCVVDSHSNTRDHLYVLSRIKKNFKEISLFVDMNLNKDIRDDFVKVLSEFDFVEIGLGVQSFNDEVLKFLKRKVDYEELFFWSNLPKNKFKISISIILGLPYQTYLIAKEDIEKTFNFGIPVINILTALPGSEVLNHWKGFDMRFSEKSPYTMIESKFLTKEEILDLIGLNKIPQKEITHIDKRYKKLVAIN